MRNAPIFFLPNIWKNREYTRNAGYNELPLSNDRDKDDGLADRDKYEGRAHHHGSQTDMDAPHYENRRCDDSVQHKQKIDVRIGMLLLVSLLLVDPSHRSGYRGGVYRRDCPPPPQRGHTGRTSRGGARVTPPPKIRGAAQGGQLHESVAAYRHSSILDSHHLACPGHRDPLGGGQYGGRAVPEQPPRGKEGRCGEGSGRRCVRCCPGVVFSEPRSRDSCARSCWSMQGSVWNNISNCVTT